MIPLRQERKEECPKIATVAGNPSGLLVEGQPSRLWVEKMELLVLGDKDTYSLQDRVVPEIELHRELSDLWRIPFKIVIGKHI